MNIFHKKILWIVLTLALILGSYFLARYLALFEARVPQGIKQGVISQNSTNESESENKEAVSLSVEMVAEGLSVPWSLVFTSSTRMLVTERAGNVRVIEGGRVAEEPLYRFREVVSNSEEGLMGLAIDPEYATNKYLYFSLAYEKNGSLFVKVVRLRDDGTELRDPFVLINDIPAAKYHAGSRIKFGPDQKLYVTTGDATNKDFPQDIKSTGGKILRINADGSIPADNPYAGNPVWSYGHRNPQGIAWHPVTRELYATEHGPSGFDGPLGGDEINRITRGANYGWPLVSHKKSLPNAKDPLLVFTPAEAPAGADFYTSKEIPQFENQFFFAALKGEGIMRVQFDVSNPDKVLEYEKLSEVTFGRIRDIVMGPDGALYFMTSNRDGRGNPNQGDDKIYRIVKRR